MEHHAPRTSSDTPEAYDVDMPPFEPRRALDVDAVERLRTAQYEVYTYAHDDAIARGEDEAAADYHAQEMVINRIREYLRNHGLEDGAEFDDYVQGLWDVSVVKVPDSEWYAAEDPVTGDPVPSGRDRTRAFYQRMTGESYFDAPELDADFVDDEEYAELEAELDDYREILAIYTARRQGKLAGKGGEKYETALREYNEHLVMMGKAKHQDILNDPEIDREEKNKHIITFLQEEQKKLREETMQKFADSPTTKIIKWLNKGSRSQRILKSVAIGAGIGVVGAGAGLVLGGAIGAGAGIAAAAGAVSRFGRTYAIADNKRGDGMGQLKADDELSSDTFLGEADVDMIQSHYADTFERDTKKEQKKRRVAVAWGLGGVALGGAVVYGAHAAADFAQAAAESSVVRDVVDFVEPLNPFVDRDVAAETGKDYSVNVGESGDAPYVDEAPVGAPDGVTVEGIDGAAETPADVPLDGMTGGEAIATPLDGTEVIGDTRFTIQDGEGGIHFFERLGLTAEQWYDVEAELADRFKNDFYVQAGEGVRIAHPGALSPEAQSFIATRFGLS